MKNRNRKNTPRYDLTQLLSDFGETVYDLRWLIIFALSMLLICIGTPLGLLCYLGSLLAGCCAA